MLRFHFEHTALAALRGADWKREKWKELEEVDYSVNQVREAMLKPGGGSDEGRWADSRDV